MKQEPPQTPPSREDVKPGAPGTPASTPCFADRFNLLRQLVRPGTVDPKTGQLRFYTFEELADAIPRTPEGRRSVSVSRLRQLSIDRNTSPSVEVASLIARGFAELVRRKLGPHAEPVSATEFEYYLMIGDSTATPEERDRFERLHEQFTQVMAEQERRAQQAEELGVLGRYVELRSRENREEVIRALDSALRREQRPGIEKRPSIWGRLRARRAGTPGDED